MKCLDKKRIKMKSGESLAGNERIMLSLVSTGVSVCLRRGAFLSASQFTSLSYRIWARFY